MLLPHWGGPTTTAAGNIRHGVRSARPRWHAVAAKRPGTLVLDLERECDRAALAREALKDLRLHTACVIAPLQRPYPLADRVEVVPLSALRELLE